MADYPTYLTYPLTICTRRMDPDKLRQLKNQAKESGFETVVLTDHFCIRRLNHVQYKMLRDGLRDMGIDAQ